MSKIEEIRKRHQDRTQQLARLGPIAQYEATAEQTHQDRATLLAALDGEWQSERPAEGEWWLSVQPEVRASACLGDVMPATVKGSHVMPDRCGWYRLDSDLFTGALWQRRAVPGDPFKRGGE